jgi:endonuclease/exonuclease/phosphatase (EEP) superfamily protein YafD
MSTSITSSSFATQHIETLFQPVRALLSVGSRLKRIEAVTLVSVCALALFAISYFGNWIPLADALTVFRSHIAIVILGCAFTSSFLEMRKLSMVLAMSALLGMYPKFTPEAAPILSKNLEFSAYQKNLLLDGETPKAIAADIIDQDPDFVMLQEVSHRNLQGLKTLSSHYRQSVFCHSSMVRGVALFTVHPIIEGSAKCYKELDLVVAQVALKDRTVWIASVHLLWPFPYGQFAQASEIAEVISVLEGDVIISGDFNMVREGASVARIAGAANARVVGDAPTTFTAFSPFAPLAIDHILLPETATAVVQVRPKYGSDHNGLFARFSL